MVWPGVFGVDISNIGKTVQVKLTLADRESANAREEINENDRSTKLIIKLIVLSFKYTY